MAEGKTAAPSPVADFYILGFVENAVCTKMNFAYW